MTFKIETNDEKLAEKLNQFKLDIENALQGALSNAADNGLADEIPVTEAVTLILAVVMDTLEAALDCEAGAIALSDAPNEIKMAQIDELFTATTDQCMDIFSNTLGMGVTALKIDSEDHAKVVQFAEAVSAKKGVTH
jgi:hypothetical protein